MSLQKAKQGPTTSQQPPPPQQPPVITTHTSNFHRGTPHCGSRIDGQDYNRTVVYSQQQRPIHPVNVPQGGIAHDINKQHFPSQAGIPASSIPQQPVHHSASSGMYQGQVPVRQQTSTPSGVQPVAHQQVYHHRQSAPTRQMATMPGPPTRQQTVPMGINILSTPQNSANAPNFYGGNAGGMFLPQQSHVPQMQQTHIMYQAPHPTSMPGSVELSPSSEALSVSYIQQHPSQRFAVESGEMNSAGMYRFATFSPQGPPAVMYSQHQPPFPPNVYYQQMIIPNANRPNVAPMPNVQQPPPSSFKRERKILTIVDPTTNRDIMEDILATSRGSGNPTPPHSGASSARGTPPSNVSPPPACPEMSDIPAQFARQVAAVAAVPTLEPVVDSVKEQQHLPTPQPPSQPTVVPNIVPPPTPVLAPVSSQASVVNVSPGVVVCNNADISSGQAETIHRNQTVTNGTDVSVNGGIQNLPDKPEVVPLPSEVQVADVTRVVVTNKLTGVGHSNIGEELSDDRSNANLKKTEVSKPVEKPVPPAVVSSRGHGVPGSSETVDVPEPSPSIRQLQQPQPVIVSLPPHSRLRCGAENVKQGPPQSTPPFPVQKVTQDTSTAQPRSEKKEVSIQFGTIAEILPQSVISDRRPLLSPPPPVKLPPAGPGSSTVGAMPAAHPPTDVPVTLMRPSGAPPGVPTLPIAHASAGKQQHQAPPAPAPAPSLQVAQPKVVQPVKPPLPPAVTSVDTLPPPQAHPKQNGEMLDAEGDSVDAAEADAAAKDPKNQKCKRKGKDVPRKGDTKDGGEMDVVLDKDEPVMPQESSPAQVPAVIAAHRKPSAQDEVATDNSEETKLAEELIDKEEQRKVAEKNEENAKVSSLQQEIQPKEVPVIKETDASTKPPPLTLQLSYKEDQWSPQNPNGKMQYDRNFLLLLQQQPMSKKKPEGLPNLEVIVAPGKPRFERSAGNTFSKPMNSPQIPDFIPTFMNNNSRPQARGKSGQLGRKEQQPPKKVLLSLHLSQDVKLHKSEDAWKPTHKAQNAEDPEKEKTERLYRRVRAMLNKLTPQNFSTLMSQVANFDITTEERLAGVIDLVFEKAIDEPNFSFAYANMCKQLSSLRVQTGNGDEYVNFKKLIITKCQREFEKNDNELLLAEGNKIQTTETEEKQKELLEETKAIIRKSKLRSLGNIRFIGELFKLSILTSSIMHDCIQKLIADRDEDSIECLCRLLTTIGKDLDKPGKHGQPDIQMEGYFKQLKELSVDRKHLSSRVRFMLQDVIDLRLQKWVPRRDENAPKTIDQIHKEAEKEQLDKQALYSQPLPPKRPDDRRGIAMGSSGKRGGSNEPDVWTTVSSGKRPNTVNPERTKISKPQDLDENNLQLGPRGGTFGWGKGSSGGVKSTSQEGDRHLNSAPNRYSALAADHGSQMDTRRNNSRQGPVPPNNRDSSKNRSAQLPPAAPHRSAKPQNNRERAAAVAAVRNFASTEPRYQAPGSRDSSMTRETEPKDTVEIVGGLSDLDREKLELKTMPLLKEFLHLGDFKEGVLSVSEVFSSSNIYVFVVVSVNEGVSRSAQARNLIGKLFYELVKRDILSLDQYRQGLIEVLENAEDLLIDVPRFWEYLAEICSPMLENGAMKWSSLKDYVSILNEKREYREKFIANMITVVSKNMGPSKVAECWKASGLKLSDVLSHIPDVQKVINQYNLDFLEGNPTTASGGLSVSDIQNGLRRHLQTTTENDRVFDWINGHVLKSQQKEPAFIRALVTELASNAIKTKDNGDYELDPAQFRTHCTVIKRYVDNKDQLELQSLFALQTICHKLQHPSNMLNQLFQVLYDEEVISEEAFGQWKSSEVPQEMEGHAVAVKSVNSFLTFVASHKDQEDEEEAA